MYIIDVPSCAAEEFEASVAAWNSGQVDGFSTSTGWQYSVLNSCSPPAITDNSLEVVDVAENLGAESKEVDVFGAYERVKFSDSIGETAGTVGSADTNCVLEVAIFSSNDETVRLHLLVLLLYPCTCTVRCSSIGV